MNITKSQLIKELQQMGIKSGDTVLIHASLKSIGTVIPDAKTVIEAFLELLGETGTLAAPTLVPAYQGLRPSFNPQTTPSETGLLTELIRNNPGALRSNHPTHSVAAIGAKAQLLTADHCSKGWGPNTPWGENAIGFETPWARLVNENAKILMIGVDFNCCTMLHHVQVHYLYQKQNITKVTPWPKFDFNQLGQMLGKQQLVKFGSLGHAACKLIESQTLVDATLAIINQRPEQLFLASATKAWLRECKQIEKIGRAQAATFKAVIPLPIAKDKIGRPLHIRGVIIDHPIAERLVFLLWDQLCFFKESGLIIRQKVADVLAINVQRVILTATHTHSGYSPSHDVPSAFLKNTANAAAAAAKAALNRLEPIRVGWSSIATAGIAENRTVYLKDGRGYTQKWSNPSSWHIPQELIAGHGPEENELRLLRLERLDGSCLAVIANFSAHNSAGLLGKQISDDFYGVAMELVEQIQGKNSVALVTPGTIGDQDPTASVDIGGNRDAAYVEQLGRRLGGYIISALQNVKMFDTFELNFKVETVQFEPREAWLALAAESPIKIYQKRVKEKKMLEDITTIVIGEFAIVGVPGEFFTTPGNAIRTHSAFQYTSVFSLTNGHMLYLPEDEAFEYELYGVQPSIVAMAKCGTASKIAKIATRMLSSLAQNRKAT